MLKFIQNSSGKQLAHIEIDPAEAEKYRSAVNEPIEDIRYPPLHSFIIKTTLPLTKRSRSCRIASTTCASG
jgi:hypothetical protein